MEPGLTARNLLDIWEQGLLDHPLKRVLRLLAVAYPEWSVEQWKEMPVGLRDGCLLNIREALFGPNLNCVTTCPNCNEHLEIALSTVQIRAAPTEALASGIYSISLEDCELQFRLPNTSDLLSIASVSEQILARRMLFERCILQAKRNGVSLEKSDIPDGLAGAAATRMSELDPQADVQIALTCPACSHQWLAIFDIASYLWTEMNGWALRILDEIHRLASAYGWSEADILALSPMRRQLYLGMIG
jgi:hypothetical protein